MTVLLLASRARVPLRLSLVAGLLLVLQAGAGPGRPAQAAGPSALPPSARPEVTAVAAVALEAASGAVLYEKQAHDRLPPASLTKMVTAMVALERGRPDTAIVATERSMVEPSVIGLEPGDRLPLSEALYGLLLQSGNDAALAIAETLGDGSIEAFVGWMNALAESLGLRDSHFANPHGLDVDEHFSSAYDMAVVGRALTRQAALRQVVGATRHQYPGPPLWVFRNINAFLATYPGADGIKTGYEIRAGRCLAASATRDGRQIIVVVLNSAQVVADSSTLMDYAFSLPAGSPSSSVSAVAARAGPEVGSSIYDLLRGRVTPPSRL